MLEKHMKTNDGNKWFLVNYENDFWAMHDDEMNDLL